MEENKPEAPSLESHAQEQIKDSGNRELPSPTSATPTTGRRTALRELRRELTEEDIKSSGAQKLLLDMLREADDELEELRPYVNRFHDADKNVAVLREKIKTHTAIEIFFGVGVGLGGTIIGLAPFLGSTNPTYRTIAVIVGFVLMIGAIIGRAVKK